jgi:putative AbiEi antitoxin of type IV toxin-antitoxin system
MDSIRRLGACPDGIVTLTQARDAGVERAHLRRLRRHGRWRPLARAVYQAEAGRVVARRARIRAAVLSYGPHAVAVLGTAAELHGIAGLPATDLVHVSLPGEGARPRRPTDPTVSVHQLVIPPIDVGAVDGIPCTVPARTVADLILRTDRLTAVSVLDSALNRQLIAPDDLPAVLAMLRRRRGAVQARRYVAQADGRAQSPLETRVRLRCADGRVAPETLQHLVLDDDGYVLGAADLAWPRARLVAEADGRGPHDLPYAVYRDRRRQNLFIARGWTVLRFTWSDTIDPGYIPQIVRAALADARRS